MASDVIDLAQKLVKLQGEFVWHAHKDTVHAGEMFVLPKGVEHIG
jgi:hypothetical protein